MSDDRNTNRIQTLVSDGDLEEIRQAADREERSVSAFMRLAALERARKNHRALAAVAELPPAA
jgi:uncharacterized protein (DUF1778 family)